MEREELVLACTSDIAGRLRGKAFPAAQLEKRLRRGIGWTPTNVQITCFDTIADSPFGSLGDLSLIPDPNAVLRIAAEGGPPETTMLGDIRHTDGRPWELCTRSILRAALERLESVAGFSLRGAFEHEFQICDEPVRPGTAFSASDFRVWRPFAESVVAAMSANGFEPDTFLREFGPAQFEVTMDPTNGLAIADRAVFAREIVQSVAARFGRRASFAPIRDPAGVGNGVHVHMGLVDRAGCPASHDPDRPHELSHPAAQFGAGILAHLPSMTAITAPSAVSYLRLVPHRWSAAFNNLGFRDREAACASAPSTSGRTWPAAISSTSSSGPPMPPPHRTSSLQRWSMPARRGSRTGSTCRRSRRRIFHCSMRPSSPAGASRACPSRSTKRSSASPATRR